MSKYTRLQYKDFTLHVVDTPGHADFGVTFDPVNVLFGTAHHHLLGGSGANSEHGGRRCASCGCVRRSYVPDKICLRQSSCCAKEGSGCVE